MKMLITNGGPHPADKWAEASADTIVDLIQVADDSATPEAAAARAAKRELRPKLFDIFNDHHGAVQSHEQAELAKDSDRHAAELDPTAHLPSTMEQVDAALAATPFAAHFAQPEVKAALNQIVGQHTADVMHIERRWHADRLQASKGN